jgi:hypothetical protein
MSDDDNPMTPARAEAITALGARLAQMAHDAGKDMILPDLFSALAMAVRGIGESAARGTADALEVPLDEARELVLQLAAHELAFVLAIPSALVKLTEGDASGPVEFGATPAHGGH